MSEKAHKPLGPNRKSHDQHGREMALRANTHLLPLVELWGSWLEYWDITSLGEVDPEEMAQARAMVAVKTEEILQRSLPVAVGNIDGLVNFTYDVAQDRREQAMESQEPQNV
jgi:hypothetical protein